MMPVDRRGLGEIIAWSVITTTTAAVLIVSFFKGDSNSIHMAFGLFAAASGSLLARGTKGAIDRDAITDNQPNPPKP